MVKRIVGHVNSLQRGNGHDLCGRSSSKPISRRCVMPQRPARCCARCAPQDAGAVKDVYKFQDRSTGVALDLISYKRILSGMVALRERTGGVARLDRKKDHWLLQAVFGLCLVALVIWLVALYRGYVIVA